MMAKRLFNHSIKVIKSHSPQLLHRKLCNNVRSSTEVCQEIEIKVPWGKVAGKLWGSEKQQPLLAIHGWQDNAGSFDILAPLLLENASILAIDLPGHGLSSWLPPGCLYQESTYLMLIQRLKRHFGWEKVKLLAHSMGAQMSFWHASVFPEETQFVIALDAYKLPTADLPEFYKLFNMSVTKFFELEGINTQPPLRYTEKDMLNRWIAATNNSLDEQACKVLMKRGSTQVEDGKFVFNRDQRLKILPMLAAFTHVHVQHLVNCITCPYLIVKAESSPFFDKKDNFYDILDTMKRNNKNVVYQVIPGKHHLHMTNANAVANVVNPYLEKFNR